MFTQLTLYTPTKTDDGEGGWTRTLGAGTTIWGLIQVHESELQVLVRTPESVNPEDIILADTKQYRVIGRRGHVTGPYTAYDVQAITKPIVP